MHRHELFRKDNEDEGWGWSCALWREMHRTLWTKVYRLFESFLVRITVRTAMASAMAWSMPTLGHLIKDRRWVKPPSTREKSFLDHRSCFSWGTLQPQQLRGQRWEGWAIQQILWTLKRTFLTKILDTLNTDALLDLLLINKKQLVREWQSRAALAAVADIALRILKKKCSCYYWGSRECLMGIFLRQQVSLK